MTGCLFVGLSSSSESESLLLEAAAFFAGCCATGLVTGVGLTCVFLCVSSSDESESDDVSCFLLLERLAGGGTAAFVTVGATLAEKE